jgi:hypothetical protein
MNQERSSAAGVTAGTVAIGESRQPDGSATVGAKQVPKWARVLRGFLDRGQRGWNRFEAARELRDHVLPTTVSQFEARGITIRRRDETVPGHFGPVHCCRYWIAPGSIEDAAALLTFPESRLAAARLLEPVT